eukprot:m.123891 g.123891  ORF g.123891 m.123891 type:complete len:589 (-) comp16269_c0_seq2:245-2011(-)
MEPNKPRPAVQDIKAMMEQAKRQIEERMRMVRQGAVPPAAGAVPPTAAGVPPRAAMPPAGFPPVPLQPVVRPTLPGAGLVSRPLLPTAQIPSAAAAVRPVLPTTAAVAAAPAAGGIQDIASFSASIQARLANLKRKDGDQPDKPMPLLLDEEGRVVDATGKVVKMQLRAELKANQRVDLVGALANKAHVLEKAAREEAAAAAAPAVDPAFDERIAARSGERTRRGFRFHEKGRFQSLAEKQRLKERMALLEAEIAAATKNTNLSSIVKVALAVPKKGVELDTSVPDVEWWDAAILPSRSYDDLDKMVEGSGGIALRNITQLVEHPIPIEPLSDPNKPVVLPVMLTKKERKKMRAQRRKAEEKEKMEKIRLNLIPAPAPKVKMSNLMRVLGMEAVQDPTQIEAVVKAQMAARQKQHEDANSKRKLSKEERREKKIAKLKEDLSEGARVCLFRVGSLKNAQHKYKVNVNANELYLTGAAVMHDDLSIIIAEGGPRAMKHYKNLLLRRIKWNVEDEEKAEKEDGDDSEPKKENKCELVWEGLVKKPAFQHFEMKHCRTEAYAREYLNQKNVAHYWDLALSEAVVAYDSDKD